jgi:outer membrane protein assembly factor BamB
VALSAWRSACWLLLAALHPQIGASGITAIWQVKGEGQGQAAVNAEIACFLTRRHQVVAVDRKSGAERWRIGTGEPGDETLGSAVVMAGGRVFVGDYALFGFDAASGVRRWRFEPTDGYGPGLYLGDAAGELVFAGSPAGRLYAVRQDTGRQVWSTAVSTTPRSTVFQPAVSEDVLAAGYSTFGPVTTGGLVVLDRRTGRQLWRREFTREGGAGGTGFGGGPVFTPDAVVAAGGDGTIRAFDRATGASRWTLPPVTRADGRPQDRDWRPLALSGSTIIAGSMSGAVIAVDVGSGRTKWRYSHPDGGSTGLRMSVDDRTVYVPHLGGLLVAVDIRSGRARWQIGGMGDGFSWAPIVAGNTLLAVAARLGLVALPR